MIELSFTLLETILLVWCVVFIAILVFCKLSDADVDAMEVLGIFILWPLYLVYLLIVGLYTLTLGAFIKFIKRYNKYKVDSKTLRNLQLENQRAHSTIKKGNETTTGAAEKTETV